jgi:hypothetical protein
MLNQPFTGKELFIEYETQMFRFNRSSYTPEELAQAEQDEWDSIGKTKKQAWNNMAKIINQRMRGEI